MVSEIRFFNNSNGSLGPRQCGSRSRKIATSRSVGFVLGFLFLALGIGRLYLLRRS